MRIGSSSPIIKRIINGFLLGSSAIFFLVTITTLYIDYHERISRAQSGIESAITMSSVPIARALWNYDTRQLEAEARALVELPVVFRIDILDERHQLLTTVVKPQTAPAIETTFDRPVREGGQSAVIGTLRLHVSYRPIREIFWRHAVYPALGEFVEIGAVAALLFYLLHRNIISHLLDVVRAVEKLEPGNVAQPVTLKRRPHQSDEIDALLEAINTFHREIVDERQARQLLEQEAQQLNNDLLRMGRVVMVQSLGTTIAHELNQPLGAILSNAEAIELSMVGKWVAGDPLRDTLADIVIDARRAGDIIRNLRNLLEKRDAETDILNLPQLIQKVILLLTIGPQTSKIELYLEDALPPVNGNATQLQQVIVNLVNNAREALQDSGRTDGLIRVSVQRDGARWVKVAVADNGPGISADKKASIFDPLFTTKTGGTGMGLWISQMIVEQHGAKLEVSNAEAGGAIFSFSLPVLLPS